MMIYPVYTYRGLFTILVLTGTAVLLCIALTAHFRTFAPVARTMEQLGASRARRLGLLLLWAGILGLAGVLLGALWCAAFTLCMRVGLHLEIHPLAQWPQLLFLLVGVLLTAGGYFVFGLEGKKALSRSAPPGGGGRRPRCVPEPLRADRGILPAQKRAAHGGRGATRRDVCGDDLLHTI